MCVCVYIYIHIYIYIYKDIYIYNISGADPGFEKGGFSLVPKSDTGGATYRDFRKPHQQST